MYCIEIFPLGKARGVEMGRRVKGLKQAKNALNLQFTNPFYSYPLLKYPNLK
jgi:hypothetical protein